MLPTELLVVVVPYSALKDDLLSRASSQQVRASQWDQGWDLGSPRTGLVFVSCEMATSDRFVDWTFQQLHQHETLRMIVIEEAHVPLLSADYRPHMPRLVKLRHIAAPLMLLSGTVPPSTVPSLQKFYLSQQLNVLRDPSDRPNLKYKVHDFCRTSAPFTMTLSHTNPEPVLRLQSCGARSLRAWGQSWKGS